MKNLLLYLFLAASVMAQATRVVDTNNLPSWPVGSTNIPISVDSYGRVVSTGGGSGGSGTVTSVSVTTANGVSGTVATATTTPAISLTLGAITPSSVSIGSDPADAGVIRLENAAVIAWESSPASTDITLTVNSSEQFVFSGSILSPTLITPVLGVATATSLNGLTVTTSTGTLTIPNGVVLTGPSSTGTAATLANAETLISKRIRPRAVTVASSASVTIDSDATDIYTITALAAAVTFNAPSGTPTAGQKILVRVLDNGTARGITFTGGANGWAACGITLPTTTVLSKYLYFVAIWNEVTTTWQVVATTQES